MIIVVVLLVLLVLVAVVAVVLYNGLVALRNKVEAAWSQIDVQLTPSLGVDPEPGGDGEGLCPPTSRRPSTP